jgi:hypothetical protein
MKSFLNRLQPPRSVDFPTSKGDPKDAAELFCNIAAVVKNDPETLASIGPPPSKAPKGELTSPKSPNGSPTLSR